MIKMLLFRFLVTAIAMAGIAVPLNGAVTAPANEPPEARVDFPYAVLEKSEIDFGKVTGGSPVSGHIRITNEGAVDLLVAKVRGSCGLMIASWPGEPLGQGEQLQISFRYDGNRLGPFERFITIHTNAWQKDLVVKVSGEVVPPREQVR
jgi:hypothetical protein